MTKVIIVIFLIDVILFSLAFLFGLILNIFILRNKKLIENYFTKNGHKLYVYDNEKGQIISRQMRLKKIEELIKNDGTVKNGKFIYFLLKNYKFIFFVFAIIFIFLIALICILYFLQFE